MKRKGSVAVVVVASLILAACGSIEHAAVDEGAVQGTGFNEQLYREYARLAQYEVADYDWRDVAFFNNRARRAARGESFGPQDIAERGIPEEMEAEARTLRETLVTAIADHGDDRPGPAARAQAGFDCWLQELEENIQPQHIAACREHHELAMSELTAPPPQAELPEPPPPTPSPEEAVAAAPPPLPGPFVVEFPFGSAEVDETAAIVIENAADAARTGGAKDIIVVGHADRAGPDDYNEELAFSRSLAVADALRERGIGEELVGISSYGESRPRVETPDGEREPRNRRVEIVLER